MVWYHNELSFWNEEQPFHLESVNKTDEWDLRVIPNSYWALRASTDLQKAIKIQCTDVGEIEKCLIFTLNVY